MTIPPSPSAYDELVHGDPNHSQYKHGMFGTRPYSIWRSMLNRCYRKQEVSYPRYGGKGIKVCPAWWDFQDFWNDMGPTYFEDATIDRIDNKKGYSKENCRWATPAEQNRNKSSVRRFEYHGEMLTISDVAKISGLKNRTIYARLVRYGWNVARCINTPTHYGNRYVA